MKRIAILFLLLGFQVTASFGQKSVATTKPATAIIKEIKSGKAYLVDVRTPEEFAGGHLENAKNIDFYNADFKSQLGKLNKKKPVYLYCRSGNRSGKATDTLQTLGFKTYYNIGGFENLKGEGYPVAVK